MLEIPAEIWAALVVGFMAYWLVGQLIGGLKWVWAHTLVPVGLFLTGLWR